MRRKPVRIAAVVAVAFALVCAIDLGTGSTALSQTRHAVNTTLAWLKSMIVGGTVEAPSAPSAIAEQTGDSERRAVMCSARFFKVSADEQGLWQSLREQGIEFVQASTDPEVYYATINRAQAQSFGASVALTCFAAPRVTLPEGELGSISLRDDTPQGPRGLAMAVLPVVSSDGAEVKSTISFHDGRNGFEIPEVSTESGGAVLIRARGIFPQPEQDGGSSLDEFLLCLQVDAQ